MPPWRNGKRTLVFPGQDPKVEDQVVASKLNLVRLAIKSEPGE